jgi:ParB-like chromosome segregation protein Spo0J
VKIAKQQYRRRPIRELKQHPRNPRKGDVAAIRESIERNDFVGAVLVQRSTGYILAGNHRLLAAQEAGLTELPILEVDVDDETAMRILLADNRVSDLAEWDDAPLRELLAEIGVQQGTLEGTGFDASALRRLEAELDKQPPPDLPLEAGHAEYRCPSCGHTWAGSRKPDV